MSMLHLLFATLLSASLLNATRVSVAKTILGSGSGSQLSACEPGTVYGLDAQGNCKADPNEDGTMDQDADDDCCLDCDPRVPYGRDEEGRCWFASLEGDGLFDSYANGECCGCNPTATYGRDVRGKCRTDINKNGILDRFAKDICCHDEEMETVTQDSVHESSHCPEVSVKVPPSSVGSTYRFAAKYIATQQCQAILQGSMDMRHRMREIMYEKQLSERRTQHVKDCVACVSGHPEKVSQPNGRNCKIYNPGRVNEGGCFVAGSDGKPTQTKVEDSCCEKK